MRLVSHLPNVSQYFQTSLKPLGQFNSNFMWRLLKLGERKFAQMFLVTMPIYGKNPLNIFFSRTKRLMALGLCMWHLGCGSYQNYTNGDIGLTKQ